MRSQDISWLCWSGSSRRFPPTNASLRLLRVDQVLEAQARVDERLHRLGPEAPELHAAPLPSNEVDVAHVRALEAQGRAQDAARLAIETFARVHEQRVQEAYARAGSLERAWINLGKVIDEAHDRIFTVKGNYGEEHSVLEQAAATAECARIRDNANAEANVIETGCDSAMVAQMTAGPAIFGFATPNIPGLAYASKECEAKKAALNTATENQCASVLNQAGLQNSRDELQRNEDLELMTINAEIDQAIRESDIEVQRAALRERRSVDIFFETREDCLRETFDCPEHDVADEAVADDDMHLFARAIEITAFDIAHKIVGQLLEFVEGRKRQIIALGVFFAV